MHMTEIKAAVFTFHPEVYRDERLFQISEAEKSRHFIRLLSLESQIDSEKPWTQS